MGLNSDCVWANILGGSTEGVVWPLATTHLTISIVSCDNPPRRIYRTIMINKNDTN